MVAIADTFTHFIWFGASENRATIADKPAFLSTPNTSKTVKESGLRFNVERYRMEVTDYRANKRPSATVACITAITGGYEDYCPPQILNPAIDYFCFTDNADLVVPHPVEKVLISIHQSDPTRLARAIKIRPWEHLPRKYSTVVWIDGNITLQSDLSTFINQFRLSEKPIGLIRHPLRTSVIQEIDECSRREKDDPRILQHQKERLLEHFDLSLIEEEIGLFETNFLVYNCDHPDATKLGLVWSAELLLGSKRDQIALPIALWRTKSAAYLLGDPHSILPRYNAVDFAFCERHQNKLVYFDVNDPLLFPTTAPKNLSSSGKLKGRTTPSISIIITVCNAMLEFNELIASLRKQQSFELKDLEVLVIDDAGDEPVDEAELTSQIPKAKLIRNAENLGYTKSANKGIELASGDVFILLNSDTVLPELFLRRVADAISDHPNVHLMGPLSNAASFQSVPHLADPVESNTRPDSVSLEDMQIRLADEAAQYDLPLLSYTELLNGFCLIIRKEVFQSIGGFNELKFPRGYGEEDDFLIRAQLAGFKSAILSTIYVHHHKSRSFGSTRRAKLVTDGRRQLISSYGEHVVDRLAQTSLTNTTLAILRSRIDFFFKSH